ncbi:hypothetical protein BJ546DRAFT_325766 [Cryomyces antarcticus]
MNVFLVVLSCSRRVVSTIPRCFTVAIPKADFRSTLRPNRTACIANPFTVRRRVPSCRSSIASEIQAFSPGITVCLHSPPSEIQFSSCLSSVTSQIQVCGIKSSGLPCVAPGAGFCSTISPNQTVPITN